MSKYWAQADGRLEYLGVFYSFDDAETAAPENTVWILDETEAKQWYESLGPHMHEAKPKEL